MSFVAHSAESSRNCTATETRSFVGSLRIPAQSPIFKLGTAKVALCLV